MAVDLAAGGLLLSGLLFSGSTVATWRRREAPGADRFAVTSAIAGIGAIAIAASSVWGQARGLDLTIVVVVALLLPVPWLLFALEYTGRNDVISGGLVGPVAILPLLGLLATIVIFGSQLLPWISLPSQQTAGGAAEVLVTLLTMLQWLALFFAGGLMLVGSGVVLLTFHRYSYLDSTTGTLLGVFGTIPWLSLVFGLQLAGSIPSALPATVAVGFLIGGIAAAVSLERYHLFRNVPAAGTVGPETVIDELADAMLVTDAVGTIVELNPAAEGLLGEETEIIGGGIREFLDVPLDELEDAGPLRFRTGRGRRLYDPTVSTLSDHHGHRIGHTVILRDVTLPTTRRQRLEVLNRVLRHNLRNTINVVLGRTELLDEAMSDPELRAHVSSIEAASEELVRLSERARDIEEIMAPENTTITRQSVAELVDDAIDSVTVHHPAAEVDVDIPDGVVFEGDAELLRVALRHLIENAIEHADRDPPVVSVQATLEPETDYPVVISIADNGPGIPETEVQVIEAETETPLQHGSGLGLWVVRWALARMGGILELADRDPRGSGVTMRLPAAQRWTHPTRHPDDVGPE